MFCFKYVLLGSDTNKGLAIKKPKIDTKLSCRRIDDIFKIYFMKYSLV